MKKYIPVFAIALLLALVSCQKEKDAVIPADKAQLTDGFVLYTFIKDKTTLLIDNDGNTEKSWTSGYPSAGGMYLSDDKSLLRMGTTPAASNGSFSGGGGVAGIIEELDDESNEVWDFQLDDDDHTLHHDFKEISSGQLIALTWSLAMYNGKTYWNEKIIIIDRNSKTISWEWSAMDDGGLLPGVNDKADYLHFNSVDYEDGQILVSSRNSNTLYLINKADKSIVAEYTAGGVLEGQHDAQFLDNGNILLFNNIAGNGTSAVLEIDAMDNIIWQFSGTFFSDHISGVQRLSTGNTLICSGTEPLFLEVSSEGEEVWRYVPPAVSPNIPGSVFKVRKYREY